MNKRYFSIQDVASLVGATASKLRYTEKQMDDFAVNKIRNRRYYSIDDVEQLLSYGNFNISIEDFKQKAQSKAQGVYSPVEVEYKARILPNKISTTLVDSQELSMVTSVNSDDIIKDIDILLSKFQNIVEKSFS